MALKSRGNIILVFPLKKLPWQLPDTFKTSCYPEEDNHIKGAGIRDCSAGDGRHSAAPGSNCL